VKEYPGSSYAAAPVEKIDAGAMRRSPCAASAAARRSCCGTRLGDEDRAVRLEGAARAREPLPRDRQLYRRSRREFRRVALGSRRASSLRASARAAAGRGARLELRWFADTPCAMSCSAAWASGDGAAQQEKSMRSEELVAILDRVLFTQDSPITVGDQEVAANITDALFRISTGLHRLARAIETRTDATRETEEE
jgi:hypothetical protein